MNAVDWIIERFKEPSSYAAAGGAIEHGRELTECTDRHVIDQNQVGFELQERVADQEGPHLDRGADVVGKAAGLPGGVASFHDGRYHPSHCTDRCR